MHISNAKRIILVYGSETVGSLYNRYDTDLRKRGRKEAVVVAVVGFKIPSHVIKCE